MAGVLSGVSAIVVTLLILFVLVIVHELGHFVAARFFGVKVHEFGIGFPPRARILARRGETLYTLNWLPIGGFVRLEGENGGNRRDPRSFAAQSLRRRVAILASGVAMNLALAFVILTAVTAYADPSIALRFPVVPGGSIAADLSLSPGDSLEAVDGRRFSWFDQENPLAALSADVGQKVTLTIRHADGSLEDRTTKLTDHSGMRIGYVEPGSPAATAGLAAGDTIVAIEGRAIGFLDAQRATTYLREHAGETVWLTVQRAEGGSAELNVRLRSREEIAPQRGALGVGFDPGDVRLEPGPSIRHDLAEAVQKGAQRTAQALGLVLGALGALVGSLISNPTQAPPVAGPVGITFAIGSLLQSYPPVFVLWLAGVLSANLALINILPYPPLDGGRIAVALLQAAAGNRISERIERLAYAIGFAILMVVVLWITYFDLLRGSQLTP